LAWRVACLAECEPDKLVGRVAAWHGLLGCVRVEWSGL